jgi:hypothetical protein
VCSDAADLALKNNKGFLKTKYSDARMEYAEYDAKAEERQWSVAAMFRALKAYARYEEALTPKQGSSCSQFAVYCYQAAAIHKHIGDLNIGAVKLKQIKMAGGFSKLSTSAMHGNQESTQLIEVVQQAEEILASKHVPSALMTLANSCLRSGHCSVQLNQTNSRLRKISGNLVPDNRV